MRAYKIIVPPLLALTFLLPLFLANYSHASLPEANQWTNLNPVTRPPVTADHAMAYDSLHDVVVLFGGYMGEVWPPISENDTWVYECSSNTWTNMSPTIAPPGMQDHAMVYDSDNDLVVYHYGSQTWVYNYSSNTWTDMNPTTYPSVNYGPVMVYDSADHVVIYFDGNGDTWVYEYLTNTWTDMNPTTSPSEREYSAMVYDSINNVSVLFGGYGDAGYLDDTWVYNYSANTWTNMNPTTHPAAREAHAMAYDSHDGVVVLFGGEDVGVFLNDTWIYDVSTNSWTEKNPSTYPPARGYFAMIYNGNVDKVILFGGCWWSPLDSGSFDDTWAYDYTSRFTLGTFPRPFSLVDYNTFIVIPISDPHGPCGAAHTMDTMGGIRIANTIGLEGRVVETAMDSYSYISTYDPGTDTVTMTDTTSQLIVLASPGVNQVAYYYNELLDDGEQVLPVLFLRDVEGDYLYVQSSGNIYRIEEDLDGVTTAEYGVIQLHPDADRYVLIVYGLGGESTMASAKVLAEYDQWNLSGSAVIVKYYDSNADGYLDTTEIVETVP